MLNCPYCKKIMEYRKYKNYPLFVVCNNCGYERIANSQKIDGVNDSNMRARDRIDIRKNPKIRMPG